MTQWCCSHLILLIILLLSVVTSAFQTISAHRSESKQLRTLQFARRDEYEYEANNGATDVDLNLSFGSSQPISEYKSLADSNQDPANGKSLIWIIDDEEAILNAVGTYLTSASSRYQVQSFLNASVPLLLLQNMNEQQRQYQYQYPQAIVCDIMMPQISGIDFLLNIRSNQSPLIANIPFILLTAKGLTEDRIKGYDAGTDGYLMKPFDPEELVAMMEQVIQRKEFLQSYRSISIEELSDDLMEVKGLIEERDRDFDGNHNDNDSQESVSSNSGINTMLSEKEMKILELLCEGYMNKEIASELRYSTRWVERHLTVLFRKTGCNNRTELVRWAVANEYVDL